MGFSLDLVVTFLRDGRTVRVSAEGIGRNEGVLDERALEEGGAASR